MDTATIADTHPDDYFRKFCDARVFGEDKMASTDGDIYLSGKVFFVFLLKLNLGKYFVATLVELIMLNFYLRQSDLLSIEF